MKRSQIVIFLFGIIAALAVLCAIFPKDGLLGLRFPQLGEVLYRVTEIETKNGYSLLPGYAFEGSLSEDSEIEVSFTVVNQPEFKMPATGGGGFNYLMLAFPLLGATLAVLYQFFRKRKLHR